MTKTVAECKVGEKVYKSGKLYGTVKAVEPDSDTIVVAMTTTRRHEDTGATCRDALVCGAQLRMPIWDVRA